MLFDGRITDLFLQLSCFTSYYLELLFVLGLLMLELLNLSHKSCQRLFEFFVLLSLLLNPSSQFLNFSLVILFLLLVLHDHVVATIG